MDVIQDLEIRNPLTNYLYGLFDGYDYSKTKNFKIQMNKLRAKDFSLHKRIKEIYSKIDKYKFEKYNDFADGGYFDGTIPNFSTYMNNFAKGGGLDSHGIKQGDTFLKTLSGGIQKVKDKNGNIFYINLATGERSATIPLPFDDGGEVKYFLNKDGIRVRSVAKPEKKLTEREWMAKHNESKEARSYAFGGLFGKSPMMSKPKKINLNDKQVRLNSGEYVQVLDQDGDTLMVMELSKIGTGASPKMVKIADVDMTSFAGGGETYSEKSSHLKGGLDYYSIDIDLFNGDEIRDLSFKSLDEAKKEYLKYSNSMVYDGDDIMDIQLIAVYKNGDYENINLNKGGALIGNQKRIDMNHNGRIDAEDFKLLRSSMNGAWRKEHKYVNSTSRKDGKVIDYEVRYARKNNPSRKGYKGKTFATGGGVDFLKRQSVVAYKNGLRASYFVDKTNDGYKIIRHTGSVLMPFGSNKEKDFKDWFKKNTDSFEIIYATGGGVNKNVGIQIIKYFDRKKGRWVMLKDYIITIPYSIYSNETSFTSGITGTLERDGYPVLASEWKFQVVEPKYSTGGGVSKFKMLSNKVARNYEGKRVKPQYQKEYGKVYSKEEAKEVGDKVAGKVKAMQKMGTGGDVDSIVNKKADEFIKNLKDKGISATKRISKNGIFIYGEKNQYGKYKYETYLSYSEVPDNDFLEIEMSEFLRLHKKMATGGETKKGGQGAIMILAKKIRKEGESWKDALKRAGQQLK